MKHVSFMRARARVCVRACMWGAEGEEKEGKKRRKKGEEGEKERENWKSYKYRL